MPYGHNQGQGIKIMKYLCKNKLHNASNIFENSSKKLIKLVGKEGKVCL